MSIDRPTFAKELPQYAASERRIRTNDLLHLLSGISLNGALRLDEFPKQISISDPLEEVTDKLWDTSQESDAESTSTVMATFDGSIKSAEIIVGGHGAVRAENLIPPVWNRFYRPRLNIHTHLEPFPFSIGDLLNVLKKSGHYSAMGYFPAMMVVNEGGTWVTIRSRETPHMEEMDFWSIAKGLDHRVTNDASWQNVDLFSFMKEYNLGLYRGDGRNTQLLTKVPRSR